MITSYNISYTGEIFDTDTQFVTVPNTDPIYPAVAQVSFDLTRLQEYNNYTIKISAVNSVGMSEFTAGVIQITDEAGKKFSHTIFLKYISCIISNNIGLIDILFYSTQ